jgi:prepilin-type N-terminal cleavage/methylation domain-containing protein
MLNTLYRYQARKAEDDSEVGFTLIELLIVIVVLGILAAVTVFALSGVSGKSAQAACNSDASSVNTALAAYDAQTGYVPGTAGGVAPATNILPTSALLVPTYLQSFPNSTTHYTISIGGATPVANAGMVMVATPTATTAVVWTPGSTVCNNAT